MRFLWNEGPFSKREIGPKTGWIDPKDRRCCKLATKQRGYFIVPNLVLRPAIGPKAGFCRSLTARFRGLASWSGKVIVSRPAKLSSDRQRCLSLGIESDRQNLLARGDIGVV